jgi:YidC/Oxa1 family membrane protein insertase
MDRNTLLAFFLIALVLVFTPYYMEIVAPIPTQADSLQTVVDYTPDTSASKTKLDDPPAATKKAGVSRLALGSNKEHIYKIDTDLFSASISSKHGGSLVSFETFNYADQDNNYLNLINGLNKENLAVRYKNIDGEDVDLSEPWVPDNNYYSGPITKPTTFSFSINIGPNKTIKKSLTFYPDKYVFDVNINMENVADVVFAGTYTFGWYGGLAPTEKNEKDDLVYFYSYAFQGGELVDLKVNDGESESMKLNGSTDWVAVRTKYFIASIIPGLSHDVSSAIVSGKNNGREIYDMAVSLPASSPSSLRVYFGPLEYDRIKSVGKELESVMNFGFWIIRPISKGVLWLLKKMNQYIPNYGFVLVIFSVLVKILVYPLTKKSYESTSAMQRLAPEIALIREKLKENPQKLNQATMKLYKDRGVNPLGGCLPMLLQMPLLFALFQVFRTTIELRAEPFIFWVKDLSAPDAVLTLPFSIPIYGSHVAVLPILMVVSMFIQQRMMSGGVEQQAQQKTMMYFMTGFFFLLFNSFPSGLNLYYTLFNVLTIIQQKFITGGAKPPAELKPVS